MYKTALIDPANVLTLSKSVECSIDPVTLMHTLEDNSDKKNRILLESCEIENKQQLKSILMNKAALRIECQKNRVFVTSLSPNGLNALNFLSVKFEKPIQKIAEYGAQITLDYANLDSTKPLDLSDVLQMDEDSRLKQTTPIDCLRKINSFFKSQSGNSYAIFLCGLFSFDLIASFEELPDVPFGDNDSSDYVFYLAEELIVINHQTKRAMIHSNIFSGEDSEMNYYEQSRRIETITNQINKSSETSFISSRQTHHLETNKEQTLSNITCDISNEQYEAIVVQLKKEIVAGNIFQVVPSRTFSLKCNDNLLAYQHLKQTNPSPYMFYMQDQDFVLFGASPESALKYHKESNQVELYPIAGTRARGKYENGQIDHDLDKRFEAELKLDTKEISEHMMLVDLARNDIAKISISQSLQIPRLLEVDRYSQVMHLVSCVQGRLKQDLDCFHAYQACMNMGTLTGAPKIKASELIRKTEKKRRGSYGGAVGYINTQADMDTCIVIRSAYCKKGIAYIQAGAGIVFDSVPKAEADETRAKAQAVIHAIQQANLSQEQQNRLGNKQ